MMWQQWLLGDSVQNIPPLKILTSADVAHLDALPLAAGERRRPARKVLADLRFLMMYVEMKVREANRWTDNHTATGIAQMFRVVEHHFIITSTNRSHNRRDSQIKWQTMVQLLRKREKQHRQQQQQQQQQ
jgi:putative protein kinase ArgK-like GTPase of G3E family